MLKKFKSQISIFCLAVMSGMSFADGISVTGYAFNTTFADNDFHKNRNILAVNVDADYSNFAIRTQLATFDAEETIRRGVLEYAAPVFGNDTIVQVGRFSRVDSFYNGVLDAPGNYQMAILPFAGYSYRMYNGSFTAMDGINLITNTKVKTTLITTRLAYGTPVVNQESLQKEAFRKYDENINMKGTHDNWDASIKLEHGNYSAYISKHFYQTKLSTTSTLLPYKIAERKFHNNEYDLSKFGIQYDNKKMFLRTELTKGHTTIRDANKRMTAEVKAFDYNIVSGCYINDFVLYAGYSHGDNKTRNTINEDTFLGATYNFKNLVVSAEYHKVHGNVWVKYATTPINRWYTWIISTTYSF